MSQLHLWRVYFQFFNIRLIELNGFLMSEFGRLNKVGRLSHLVSILKRHGAMESKDLLLGAATYVCGSVYRQTPLNAMASKKRSCTSRNSCQKDASHISVLFGNTIARITKAPLKRWDGSLSSFPSAASNIIIFNDPSTQLCEQQKCLSKILINIVKTYVYRDHFFFARFN